MHDGFPAQLAVRLHSIGSVRSYPLASCVFYTSLTKQIHILEQARQRDVPDNTTTGEIVSCIVSLQYIYSSTSTHNAF